MNNTLDDFAAQLREALSTDQSDAGKQKVCEIVSVFCRNEAFVAQHLKTRTGDEPVREVLYEDEAMGFCICGHVFNEGQNAAPHDHGPSWAVYGQVTGQTIMTDWDIVDPGTPTMPKRVVQTNTYTLNPGNTHLYDVGAVHSLVRATPVKTIRIEGENLDNVQRSHIVVDTSS